MATNEEELIAIKASLLLRELGLALGATPLSKMAVERAQPQPHRRNAQDIFSGFLHEAEHELLVSWNGAIDRAAAIADAAAKECSENPQADPLAWTRMLPNFIRGLRRNG